VKAIVLRAFGGPEVLQLEDVPDPRPSTGQVLVKVGAVSVNRSFDLGVRTNTYAVTPKLPHILGADPSGTIVEVGDGVDVRWLGRRVYVGSPRCGECEFCLSSRDTQCVAAGRAGMLGVHRWGGYAELVAVPANSVVPIPDELPFPEATVVGRHFPTACHLLETKAQLQPGEWVLIMGAAGGLGNALVQIARATGGRVIAAAGRDDRVQSCVASGAHFGVNYRTHDLAAEVLKITDGAGVQVVAENIADPTLWVGAFNSLAPDGRLVTAGAHGGGTVPLDVRRLYLRRITIMGNPNGGRAYLERALHGAATGQLHAVIGKVLPLSEASEAHRLAEGQDIIGKVILQP
jgi:NADPH2:quinone reductase